MELNITGLNEITYPSLHVWNWMVAVYLFLGGLAGGLLVMSSIANLRKWSEERSGYHCIKGALYAPFILAAGMVFIFLDLDRKLNVYWFYLTFQPSATMSWGAWAIALTIPISFLYGLSVVPADMKQILVSDALKRLSDRLNPHMRQLAAVSFALGIFLCIYTGLLLSSMLARPLWNSPLLPVLFLLSGLSTGAALLIIIARKTEIKLFLTKIEIWVIFAEILVIILFFYGQYKSPAAQRASILPFFTLSHEYFPYFLAILFISILLPLALVLKLVDVGTDHAEEIPAGTIFRMNLSALMVLAGGFIIRLSMLYAGQLSSL